MKKILDTENNLYSLIIPLTPLEFYLLTYEKRNQKELLKTTLQLIGEEGLKKSDNYHFIEGMFAHYIKKIAKPLYLYYYNELSLTEKKDVLLDTNGKIETNNVHLFSLIPDSLQAINYDDWVALTADYMNQNTDILISSKLYYDEILDLVKIQSETSYIQQKLHITNHQESKIIRKL